MTHPAKCNAPGGIKKEIFGSLKNWLTMLFHIFEMYLELVCMTLFLSGRTGVIIACYLVFTNRITGRDAIHYVREKRYLIFMIFVLNSNYGLCLINSLILYRNFQKRCLINLKMLQHIELMGLCCLCLLSTKITAREMGLLTWLKGFDSSRIQGWSANACDVARFLMGDWSSWHSHLNKTTWMINCLQDQKMNSLTT